MNVIAIRAILVYLIQPADTSTGGQLQHGTIEDSPEKTIRGFDILKTLLWTCLAIIVSLCLSSLH